MFSDEVNRTAADNTLNKHPKDFALYYLGEYETETATHNTIGLPERIIEATDTLTNKETK